MLDEDLEFRIRSYVRPSWGSGPDGGINDVGIRLRWDDEHERGCWIGGYRNYGSGGGQGGSFRIFISLAQIFPS